MYTQFTEEVIEIIKNIPKGKVQTYGGISKLAGSPFAARQVVRILSSMSDKHNLPWQRVINSKGELPILNNQMFAEQKILLEKEKVEVSPEGKVNLKRYLWNGN
ncbi:TPA: DNA methyltransferase [Candidatus Delongbacteria bacterium]|nr:MAG: DNA methyltransferase [Candidatus Delongbacteria bacterium GWF2_40_14]HAQ62475.1 DNA methyltransferase [Candidatus Delongbacteria bacterium]